jgi:hypothetical protein
MEFKANLELPGLHQSFEFLAAIQTVFGGLLTRKILAKLGVRLFRVCE